MGLLLHLSDLHLTPPSAADVTGDYDKMPLVPLRQRQSRTATIRNTCGRSAPPYLPTPRRWTQSSSPAT